jgi:clumping factor A
MIVFSLLLILVAVTLLVMGLAGGSSSLLIASIVASLLAAIALVIGARQAAVARRAGTTGPDPLAVDLDADPGPAEPAVTSRASRRRRDAEQPVPVGAAGAGNGADHAEAAAFAAGGRDADEVFGTDARPHPEPATSGFAAAGYQAFDPSTGVDAGFADARPDDADGARYGDESQVGRRSSGRAEEPDYDRAATFIGGARAQDRDDDLDRDPAAAEAEAAPAADAGSVDAPDDVPGSADELRFSDGSGISNGSGLSEEFGEPDPDDPADEPLPQAFRPQDAVRVARMDAEVLVVDGRPRYHLADCPHLVGRLTEPLAVSEAVELGFSPCGLCRPIDRLVAAAARR